MHEIPAGEVVLGQKNTYNTPAAGPVVPASDIAAQNLKPAAIEGFFDLGLNGTYLVFRQLKQDVAMFWNNMKNAADGLLDEMQRSASAEWLATKMVGRALAGNMLTPNGAALGNDMTFFANDRRLSSRPERHARDDKRSKPAPHHAPGAHLWSSHSGSLYR
jgi:hypothetical protein